MPELRSGKAFQASDLPLRNITKQRYEEMSRGASTQPPPGLPALARRCLASIDTRALKDGNILCGLFDAVFDDIHENQWAGDVPRDRTAEECRLIDMSAGAGRLTFLMHDLLPKTDIVSLISDPSALATARRQRTDMLMREGTWEELEDGEDSDLESNEMEYHLLHFLKFDVTKTHMWEPFVIPSKKTKSDRFAAQQMPDPKLLALSTLLDSAHAVISSFFLEYAALSDFFKAVSSVLKPDPSHLLVTTLHPDLGRKYRVAAQPGHHVYSEDDILNEGRRWGFTLVKSWVRKASQEDVQSFPGYEDWVGQNVWLGMVLKSSSKW